MNGDVVHPLVSDYLGRLRRAARTLPGADRRELCADIEAHLAETTSAASADEHVLNVLDRLGDPAEIVDAQRPQRDVGRSHVRERWAIGLLLVGGFAFGAGWLVGLLLLWASPVWTRRDKLMATLIVPGGLALAPFGLALTGTTQKCLSSHMSPVMSGSRPSVAPFLTPSHCTGGATVGTTVLSVLVLVVLLIAPLATARHLALRLKYSSAGRLTPAR